MLSAAELARVTWGQEFRRVITAAAALRGVFSDRDMADAFGVSPGGLRDWWKGAKPATHRLPAIADTTGLDRQALLQWVHGEGDPPPLPAPDSAIGEGVRTGVARGRRRQARRAPHRRPQSPKRPHPDSGAGLS